MKSINNKCKAFTSLEQSKKLAEILPIQSADMRYDEYTSHIDGTPKVGYKEGITEGIPCWSIAALLGVLPNPSLHKTFSGWRCDSYNKEGTSYILGEPSDNTIDACYEMILKLHELKMV